MSLTIFSSSGKMHSVPLLLVHGKGQDGYFNFQIITAGYVTGIMRKTKELQSWKDAGWGVLYL